MIDISLQCIGCIMQFLHSFLYSANVCIFKKEKATQSGRNERYWLTRYNSYIFTKMDNSGSPLVLNFEDEPQRPNL
jgi:hypothetical protein